MEERNLLRFFDPSKQWDGSQQGRLLVVGTRCFGDMIKWSRFFPVMEERKVDWALLSWPELVPIFKRALPTAKIFSSADRIPPHDFWIPALWLHEHFGTHRWTKPLLITASPEKIKKYKFLRQRTQVIGLCWEAAEWSMSNKYRRLNLEEVKRITDLPVRWVNLQYQSTKNPQMKDFLRALPNLVNVDFDTWEDTAGLVHNLDGVVSADTSVPHFTASMKKPTIVLHGRAATSVTEYQPFDLHYLGSAKMFIPDYGNGSKTSTDKFLDYAKQNPEFWKLNG